MKYTHKALLGCKVADSRKYIKTCSLLLMSWDSRSVIKGQCNFQKLFLHELISCAPERSIRGTSTNSDCKVYKVSLNVLDIVFLQL